MTVVPVIRTSNLKRSVRFYTEVLAFQWRWPDGQARELANGVAYLAREGAVIMLSAHAGDGVFGSLCRLFVDDVDSQFALFQARGLDTTGRPESPVHTAPVDQTWGLREFAVVDPDGNGLCFCAAVR